MRLFHSVDPHDNETPIQFDSPAALRGVGSKPVRAGPTGGIDCRRPTRRNSYNLPRNRELQWPADGNWRQSLKHDRQSCPRRIPRRALVVGGRVIGGFFLLRFVHTVPDKLLSAIATDI